VSAEKQGRPEDLYRSPFLTRWASEEMLRTWGDAHKFRLWRSLWIALAEAERELGVDIPQEAISQLKEHRDELNLEEAARLERELRHDVMAHLHAYGAQCPAARGIIHLGATSAFVGDNADLIRIRESLRLLLPPLGSACRNLADFALRYRDLPCLGYTHFQPAQPTTVGKRACLWLHDLLTDLEALSELAGRVPFRGVKGTTGTQASYLSLFDGDPEKVRRLDELVAEKMGFSRLFPVTGQTYPRKFDHTVLGALAGLAVSAQKMAGDIRLLAGLGELEEPFGRKQVGSSAMPYKRNPMRCERMAGLSRFLISMAQNAAFTAAEQWLERTLDDSSNRRLTLAESFLAADSIVRLAANVTDGLVVNEQVVAARLRAELPFMAAETILMEAVKAGGDRQELHERIRRHAMDAARRVKGEGAENDLLERIRRDEAFRAVHHRLDELTRPEQFTGRASEQVAQYVSETVEPVLDRLAPREEGDHGLRV